MSASVLLIVAGLAYLTLKAEYLEMDVPDALKAFIVAPGAFLLVAAACVGLPDARRRSGGALLVLGLLALLWTVLQPPPNGGWTFYTPESSIYGERPEWLKGPDALLTAGATLLPFCGLAILLRRSTLGAILLAGAFWCALCFTPSRLLLGRQGMPHRYAYYYFASGEQPLAWKRGDAALPILLGLLGAGLTMRHGASPQEE